MDDDDKKNDEKPREDLGEGFVFGGNFDTLSLASLAFINT